MGPTMGSISPEHDRPVSDRVNLHVVEPAAGSIAVLLCCADADADAVALRVDQIDSADVRVISGLERDTVALRDELAAMAQQSLVVVCKTEALGADAVRRAVECFGLRRTWTHRLLVLELASRHSSSWIGSVHRTLAAMQRRRSRPVDRVDPGPVRGEIVGSIRDAANAPPPEPAVVLGDDEPNMLRDDVGPIPAHVRAPGKRPAHLALVMPTTEDSDDTLSSISDACLVPPVVAAANLPVPRRRRLLLPGALAAILGGAIVGTLWMPADRTLDLAVVAGEDDSNDAGLDSTSGSTGAPSPAATSDAAPGTLAPSERPAAAEKPELSETDAAIENAIEAGLAERHGPWIVWMQAEPATDWWAAANLCRQRPLAGIRGWRLPTLTEARALRRAGGLPSVDSWTLTRAVDREGNWVAGADGRFVARDKHDAAGYAACVRK